MYLCLIFLCFLATMVLAYRFYGQILARAFGIDAGLKTPAHRFKDDVDFVPTRPFYLFSQHFSAIAAAGPIAGPIIACGVWGWLPCLIWIALGVVLVGAVHDFASLCTSVRFGAVSVAEICRKQMGNRAGLAMMAFIWLALIFVVTAFTDITAASFVGVTEELAGVTHRFNSGGAVAMGAVLYLSLSLLMGLWERYLRPSLWLTTLVFVPFAFLAVWLGTQFSTALLLDTRIWCLLILSYCFIASLLPVWLLLQPRGYLGGFFLYTVIAIGIIGVLFGGYEIKQPALAAADVSSLFPFLFVTIACGACSGFHGLVCSGTTSKQIDKEDHVHPIGYGAMLCEGIVAVIALATMMIFAPEDLAGLKPGTIYGKGIGEFLTMLVGKEHLNLAMTFGAMAFSTFIFDTLDVATRLGRYLLQELLGFRGRIGAILATGLTVGAPLFFLLRAEEGSYLNFWTLFGASNQLLAALTLLSITLWLYQAKRRIAYTLLPMLFVLATTLWALSKIAADSLAAADGLSIALVNGLIAISLIALAIFLVLSALKNLASKATPASQAEKRA